MRILVVEDEHLIASSIKKGLEQENFDVDVAYEGNEGLDLALSGGHDLIILDLMLPDVDGLEICNRIRKEGIHTPILILTARTMVSDKVTSLNSGADDYLTKPFAFEELLARVKALLRRPKQSELQTLMVGEQNIDALSLTHKEYVLLEYLIRHKNQVVSKESIIAKVWNYESDILPNTIEAYIKNIRKKLKGSSDLIQTVRGFGYKLIDHV